MQFLNILRKQWFLVGLVIFIPGGLLLGKYLEPAEVNELTNWVNGRWITAMVLFLMSFTLNSQQLAQSFRSPAPVFWAILVNAGMIPLMGFLLSSFQSPADFKVGLMIAASVPCTMAAASVWTRKGGGNDAVSLLVTMLTNGLCFLYTPLWLNWATQSGVNLDLKEMMVRLIQAVLIPSLFGQLLRLSPACAKFATEKKTPIGVIAQALILGLVFSAACKGGIRLGGTGPKPGLMSVAIVWSSCILLHLTAMLIGVQGAKLFKFSLPDRVAVAFGSSQKTLPIGVLLAAMVEPKGLTFAVFPMLMYHASQLFIDTAIAGRFSRQLESEIPTPSA